MATIEQQVAGLVTDMQAVKTSIAAVLTAVGALTPATGGGVTGAVDFTPVTTAISGSQTAILADIDAKLAAQTAQLTEVINDLEA
jgi:hypothetical protein